LTRILVQFDVSREPNYPNYLCTRIKYLNVSLRIKSFTPFNSFIPKFVEQNLNFTLNVYLRGKINFLLLWNLSRPEVVTFHLHNSGPRCILTAFGIAVPKCYMRSCFFYDNCENLVSLFFFISLNYK